MNREAFLARAKEVKTVDVELSGGEKIKARKLYQSEVEHITKNYATADKALAGYRYIVVQTALNDDSTPMFDDKSIEQLSGLAFDDVQAIAATVSEFSGMGRDVKKS